MCYERSVGVSYLGWTRYTRVGRLCIFHAFGSEEDAPVFYSIIMFSVMFNVFGISLPLFQLPPSHQIIPNPPPPLPGQARIDKVHVDGVGRTKDDLVQATVQPMFEAATLEDVITRTHEARTRLEQLGCFRSVGVFIDTSRGPQATEKGLEVGFCRVERVLNW